MPLKTANMSFKGHYALSRGKTMEVNFPVFSNKEDATTCVKKLYDKYYHEHSSDSSFSERSFARSIGISQSLLNSLRNDDRKEINANNAIKILKGIGKIKLIKPVLNSLLPESKEIFYEQMMYGEDKAALLKKEDMNGLVDLMLTKDYVHILTIVLTGMSQENTKVDHIKKISPDGEIHLKNLVDIDVLEITEDNTVRFSKNIKNAIKGRKIQFNLNQSVEYSILMHGIMNCTLVERTQEIGFGSVVTGCYHKENIPEYIALHQEFRDKLEALEKRRPGGNIKMATSILGVTLYNPYKYEKNTSKKNKDNGDKIQ